MSAERGSVLLLMPAAVLVLLVLGALAVDAALVFTAQRELANAAAAAANDAAVAALDEEGFYAGGRLAIDPDRAREVAAASFAARQADWLPGAGLDVGVEAVDGELVRVRVVAQAGVRLIFTPVTRTVRATAVASARTE